MRSLLLFITLFPLYSFAQLEGISTSLNNRIEHSGKLPVHSILLYIEDQSSSFRYSEGVGLTKKRGVPVEQDAQFRIASITKTFVASVIIQLLEEGKLQLDQPIIDYLSPLDYLNLSNIHFHNDTAYAAAITIEHLLSHRSGLADIFHDKAFPFYLGFYLNKQKQYSPEKIVEKYYRYNLQRQAHFKPGSDFYYSDMNYVLLGLLIEQIENMSLAEVIRSRILRPLNMNDTYLEFYEPARGNGKLIHQYRKRMDMTMTNTSFDWAGGGLVSTTLDLAKFAKALFNGSLISPSSLKKMTTMRFTGAHNNRYGLGLNESTFGGDTYYGHYGFYGSYAGYCPAKETVLVYNISQAAVDFSAKDMIEEALGMAQITVPTNHQ